MKCTICKIGQMEDGKVTVTLQREESIIIIKKVPATICNNCGEYILSEQVTRKLMKISEYAVANNAEIEVLQYAA